MRHSGFHVFCENRIQPQEESAMETLARYIIRASFSQEGMEYLADEGTVINLATPQSGSRPCARMTEPGGADGAVLKVV
ncbi:MAG: hypothetical protein ACYDAA_12715 [Syntrophales bacterium]